MLAAPYVRRDLGVTASVILVSQPFTSWRTLCRPVLSLRYLKAVSRLACGVFREMPAELALD